MKPWNIWFTITVALLLTGCIKEDNEPYEKLLELTRSYGGTATSLQQDTDDPALLEFLDITREEEKNLEITLSKLRDDEQITEEQKENLKKTHELITRLQVEKMQAILNSYHEITVEFIHLNRQELLPQAEAMLAAIPWEQYCPTERKLVVYGYGDPTGGELPTLRVSEGRAKNVAHWLRHNTPCHENPISARGLGVDLKAEEIKDSMLSPEEKEQIFQQSRYARILIPRKMLPPD